MERELLDHIEAFMAANDISASRFGVLAMNDKNFVRDLRAGQRRLLMETAQRVRDFMSRHEAAQAAA
ncbi:MAG: hypothetical protein MUF47_12585 [Porphyrobacter sp.]|jgi:hypothetical protein|nr:hypothetical protein [Porphyrobacter sp.]